MDLEGAADRWKRQVHGICREHQRLQDQICVQSSAVCARCEFQTRCSRIPLKLDAGEEAAGVPQASDWRVPDRVTCTNGPVKVRHCMVACSSDSALSVGLTSPLADLAAYVPLGSGCSNARYAGHCDGAIAAKVQHMSPTQLTCSCLNMLRHEDIASYQYGEI